jgi:hypothetical protein
MTYVISGPFVLIVFKRFFADRSFGFHNVLFQSTLKILNNTNVFQKLTGNLVGQNLKIDLWFKKESAPMLWTIVVVLVVLWLLGLIGNVGGGLIHILLVLALIMIVVNLISGRRGTI